MGKLVTLNELKDWLELPPGDVAKDQQLEALVTRLEALLERVKNRVFAAPGTVTLQVDGSGQAWLWLDRPLASLTSVKIGIDPATPSETITPGVTTVIAQGKRLFRQDGGLFPTGVANVQVQGTAASSLDEDARQAVLEACALVWRSRGSEDATFENVGSFSHTLRKDFMELPSWKALPRRPVLA